MEEQLPLNQLLSYPFSQDRRMVPPPEFDRLRDREPVCQVITSTGNRAWLLTRYADVRFILADKRFRLGFPGAPDLGSEQLEDNGTLFQDEPAHSRLRRLIARAFTPRRIELLRTAATQTIGELCASLVERGSPGELVSGVALPFPIAVIADLLGVTVEDRDRFREWSDAVMRLDGRSDEEVGHAWAKMSAYVDDLIMHKRELPGDDLISDLVKVSDHDDGRLTEAELSGTAVSLLVAGYSTTVTVLTKGVLTLLQQPAGLHGLVGEPALMPTAIDEILRYQSESDGLVRVAREDVKIGDVVVRKGQAVIAPLLAANHDSRVFDQPEHFDIRRVHNPHVAFGYGIHRCVGASLARMELEVAIAGLCKHFPDLRLSRPVESLPWREAVLDPAPSEIHVEWGPYTNMGTADHE